MLRIAAIVLFSVLAVGAQVENAQIGRRFDLKVAAAASKTDSIFLEIKIGSLPKRAEVELYSFDGKFLGSISPYGANRSSPADSTSIYIVPIPKESVVEGRLSIRVVLKTPNNTYRQPTKREVRALAIRTSDRSGN